MLIVLGKVQVRADAMDQALALSQQHVSRSQQEEGCISHAVYRDLQQPDTLVFVEEWADQAALKKHFAVPESLGFVKALGQLAVARPSMRILQASPADMA